MRSMGLSSPWRVHILLLIFLVAGSGIAVRLFMLQVIRSDYYSALAQGQHLELSGEAPLRGEIYFQDKLNAKDNVPASTPYFVAVTNEEKPLIFASPVEIEYPKAVAAALAPILSLEGGELEEKISNRESAYIPLLRQASEDAVRRLSEANLEGIYIAQETIRKYPAGSLAAHLLGFLGFQGDERAGQYGVESYYDEQLRGGGGILRNEPRAHP